MKRESVWARRLLIVIGCLAIAAGGLAIEHNQVEIHHESDARIRGECLTLKKALLVDRSVILLATEPISLNGLSPERLPTVIEQNAAKKIARKEILARIPEVTCK